MIDTNWPHDLSGYFERLYWPRKLGKSPRTATLYRLTFARFAEYLQRPPQLADLTDDAVCGFLRWRLDAGLASHTVDKERDKLLAIANFAARKRHLPEWLDVPPIDTTDPEPRAWTKEEIDQLLAASGEECGVVGCVRAGDWWRTFNLVVVVTGERTGATLALRIEWLRGTVLSVPGHVRKEKQPMTYVLPDVVHAAVIAVIGERRTGLIFERSFCLGTFYYRYGRILRRAKLSDDRRSKPQQLRRSFASHYEAAGGNATDALGHSSRKLTRTSYLDRSITESESASSVVAKRLGLT